MKHKHYDLCYRAHTGTSWYPEKRAQMCCSEFDTAQNELKELGASAESLEKHEMLFIAWMNAKSNCLSSMIAGPANFPVARAMKANDREHARLGEYIAYGDKIIAAIKKEKFYAENPDQVPISTDDDNAIDRLKEKLAKLEAERETNTQINKIIRLNPKGQETPEKIECIKSLGISETVAKKLFAPDFCGRIGVPAYVNTNLGGNIKRIKERIAEIEGAKQCETKEIELPNDIKCVQDTESMRVYFEFPGKPDEATRSLLKANAFKWTPSQRHWGRKLTGNAVHAANTIIQTLKNQ
jgi:hypothetical protein